MKQTNPIELAKSKEELDKLLAVRGSLTPMHTRLANDPMLIKTFSTMFALNNDSSNLIPKKYRELMTMILGASRGVDMTIRVHAQNAYNEGASIAEIAEALRIAFMVCGVSALIPASVIFDELCEADFAKTEE